MRGIAMLMVIFCHVEGFCFSLTNREYGYSRTPQEFVSIIKHVCYILTSSFYGTIFCLIFHRPMAVFKLNDGHDSCCVDLLKSVGMENMLKDISWNPILAECNYNLFDERFATLQQDSIDYLKSLKDIL